jgi:hypothetical protein
MILNYKLDLEILPVRIEIVTGLAMLKRYAHRYQLHSHPGVAEMLAGEYHGQFLGMQTMVGSCTYLLILPEELDMHTVYHESLHAANQIWYNVGARLTTDNDEVIAYTMNYIAQYIEEVCYVSRK